MTRPRVVLFFNARAPGGGSTSFAVHLYRAMELAGYAPTILRLAKRTEQRTRPLGKYDGVEYVNVATEDALATVADTPSLLVAPCHSSATPWDPDAQRKLIAAGMRVVVHDPNEFKIYDHHTAIGTRPPIAIRPTMLAHYPRAVVIPHPYVRRYDQWDTSQLHQHREWIAVSVARVTFVKRTEIILDANRLLAKQHRKPVVLRGAENRLYTRHKLRAAYPEFKQGSTGFPLRWHASAEQCARASYAVDMTYFPDDGGGSQYSFMEAWDAGTVNIIHEDWLRYGSKWPNEMQHLMNCIAVSDAQELANYLGSHGHPVLAPFEDLATVVQGGYNALRAHDPATVAHAYYEELTK